MLRGTSEGPREGRAGETPRHETKDIAVRCFTKTKDQKSAFNGNNAAPSPSFDRYLVIDAETTADEIQSLKFGSAALVTRDVIERHWLFYDPLAVNEGELSILKSVAASANHELITVTEFREQVFLPEIYDNEAPCIGFNLPFDISRIAVRSSPARERNRGGFSFKMADGYPNIVVKHVNSHYSQIKFTSGLPLTERERREGGGSRRFRGHFVDLRTATFALTNESHTLDSACKRFGVAKEKDKVKEHGKITSEYIRYNLNDVEITNQLFQMVMREWNGGLDSSGDGGYHLNVPVSRLSSPASIGKAYLRAMGVESFLDKNPDFPCWLLGKVMGTYFGGRSEVRIRLQPVEIRLLDFLSMYPTMCIIMGIWKFVISDHIAWVEATEEARQFVDAVHIDSFRSTAAWKQLNVICLVRPEGDILTVRSDFHEGSYNLGTAHVTSEKPLWYTMADVVASKLLTGKSPQILKAIRFEPVGVQDGLTPVALVGGQRIDPAKDDFFLKMGDYRHELKTNMKAIDKTLDPGKYEHYNSLQKAVKILLNSTSYGIFLQINEGSEEADMQVYGPEEPFEAKVDKPENPGPYFDPIVGTLITGAARLVLAITEALLARRGSHYAFCDTDSMAVPAEHVDEIQAFFQKLTPYSFSDKLFKLEKENSDEKTKAPVDLHFYGISAKRYVLYELKDGRPMIRKASSHGLGHIMNPFPWVDNNKWAESVWQDILDEHYGLVTDKELWNKYGDTYAVSNFSVTSPVLANRLNLINKGKDYRHKIKPFNFAIVGAANVRDPRSGKVVKPIAPFRKKAQEAIHSPFIDYSSGRVMQGEQYWKPLDDVLLAYQTHPESKFDGDVGFLQRKHIVVRSISFIGKESKNLEMSRYFGVTSEDLQRYGVTQVGGDAEQEAQGLIMNVKPGVMEKMGISRRVLFRWRADIRKGKSLRFQSRSKEKLLKALRLSRNVVD